MDCLNNFNSSEAYDCQNPPFQNCTNRLGFDFGSLQTIAQTMQLYCANDTRLFGTKTTPATPHNASLTYKFCKRIAPEPYTRYPVADILARLQTWKFPLFQLAFSIPRPPLSPKVDAFILTRLMGDPIGTITDLRRKLACCEDYAVYFENHHVPSRDSEGSKEDGRLARREWKALATICVAYDEWGEGYEARNVLGNSLKILPEDKLDGFLEICKKRSDQLARDRGTTFLPILAAEGFFVGALGVAVSKTSTIAPGSSMYINVEAHSIAFSSLYFWIIPAVFLGAVIGVSQTEASIRCILSDFESDFVCHRPLQDLHLPTGHSHKYERKLRRMHGGIYAWHPDERPAVSIKAILTDNALAVFSVTYCAITAGWISWYVPTDGWQPRHYAYMSWLALWVGSFLATSLLKPAQRGSRDGKYTPPEDISVAPFWATFAKDAIVTGGTLAALLYVQIGPFNNCEAYSLDGHAAVALPGSYDVAGILNKRIHGLYRAIAFSRMGFQLVVIPSLTLFFNRRALCVLLQNDDGSSMWPKWLQRPAWLRCPTGLQVYRVLFLLGAHRD